MITLYRSAYCGVNRAPYKFGRSIYTKPNDVENGASYIEIDTGRVYRYKKMTNRQYPLWLILGHRG